MVLAIVAMPGAGTGSADTVPAFRPAVAGRWAGQVKGSQAFVAIVVGRRQTAGHHDVLAYVCNGETGQRAARPTIVAWFHGTTSAGTFTLRSKNGFRLAVSVSHDEATGSLMFPGKHSASRSFAAAATRGHAGLYGGARRVGGKNYVAGLILLNDGHARGAATVNGAIAQTARWTGLQSARPTATVDSQIAVIAVLIGLLQPAVSCNRPCE
jgi:hypothetical protein